MTHGNDTLFQPITDRDRMQPATVADLKRVRLQTVDDCNKIIAEFQKDLIVSQTRLNLVWNAIQAVLRVFIKKALIIEKDLREAGEELMKEARDNIAAAKKAQEEGRPPGIGEITTTPLEQVQRLIMPGKKN